MDSEKACCTRIQENSFQLSAVSFMYKLVFSNTSRTLRSPLRSFAVKSFFTAKATKELPAKEVKLNGSHPSIPLSRVLTPRGQAVFWGVTRFPFQGSRHRPHSLVPPMRWSPAPASASAICHRRRVGAALQRARDFSTTRNVRRRSFYKEPVSPPVHHLPYPRRPPPQAADSRSQVCPRRHACTGLVQSLHAREPVIHRKKNRSAPPPGALGTGLVPDR